MDKSAEEIIKAQQEEIDRLKADLLFTRNEAIAMIKRKNEEIERLKR